MCLVYERKIGLEAKAMELVLSHHIIDLVDKGISSSLRMDLIHVISLVTEARHHYSASILERATVGCFLTDHKIGLVPRNIHKPEVDLLVSKQAAQSASKKPLMTSIIEGPK